MVFVFVLFKNFINCDIYIDYMESIFLCLFEMKKISLLVLVENCEIFQCFCYYVFFVVYEKRNNWWWKLLKVLFDENLLLSSGELDEEFKEEYDNLMKLFFEKSL